MLSNTRDVILSVAQARSRLRSPKALPNKHAWTPPGAPSGIDNRRLGALVNVFLKAGSTPQLGKIVQIVRTGRTGKHYLYRQEQRVELFWIHRVAGGRQVCRHIKIQAIERIRALAASGTPTVESTYRVIRPHCGYQDSPNRGIVSTPVEISTSPIENWVFRTFGGS